MTTTTTTSTSTTSTLLARDLCRSLAVTLGHAPAGYEAIDARGRAISTCLDARASIGQLILAVSYLYRQHIYVRTDDTPEDDDSLDARQYGAIHRVLAALDELADADAGWSLRCDAGRGVPVEDAIGLVTPATDALVRWALEDAVRAIVAAQPRPSDAPAPAIETPAEFWAQIADVGAPAGAK